MSFCRECGKEVQATWKVCPHCAAPQQSAQSNVVIQDSAVSGDITINNVEQIMQGMEQVLSELGFRGSNSPTVLTNEQKVQVNQLLKISENVVQSGIEIDPFVESRLASAAYKAGRIDDARTHLTRSLNSYRNLGDSHSEAVCLKALGLYALEQKNEIEAERLYRASFEISQQLGNHPLLEFGARNGLAIIAKDRGELSKARKFHEENLDLAKENNLYLQEAMSLGNIAIIESISENYDESLRFNQMALEIYQNLGDDAGIADTSNSLGILKKLQGDLVGAERHYRASLKIAQEKGYRLREALYLRNLGSLSEGERARHFFTQAVQIWRDAGIPIEQWFIDNGY